jgi:hypothetical protein
MSPIGADPCVQVTAIGPGAFCSILAGGVEPARE